MYERYAHYKSNIPALNYKRLTIFYKIVIQLKNCAYQHCK